MKQKDYLPAFFRRYPFAEPRDAVKLCYQAAFGAEHLLLDIPAAREYFDEEFSAVIAGDCNIFEPISPDYYRINLAAWKNEALPQSWLFEMFRLTASGGTPEDSLDVFNDCLDAVDALANTGFAPFTIDEWRVFFKDYDKTAPKPVHHSTSYRAKAHPAYRIVAAQYARLVPMLRKINKLTAETKIIAIDGRSASGKTTLAEALREITGAGIIHMDDFFLPAGLRTETRLNTPGGNVHHERFLSEVIPCLRSNEPFSYGVFDCETMATGMPREVAASCLRIVEGAYSHHPALGDYMDLRVFSDIDADLQLQRIKERDGDYTEVFTSRWIPLEEQYLCSFSVADKADIIIRP